MTVTVTYPSGDTREYNELDQRDVNYVITMISDLNDSAPVVGNIKITVTS